MPLAIPGAGFLNIINDVLENVVPKNKLNRPNVKIKKLSTSVNPSKSCILFFAFFVIRNKNNMKKNNTEKLPKIAFMLPNTVCSNGAMYRFR